MILFRHLLYGVLLFSLIGCPFLDPPVPVEPLARPKTQKNSYKVEICRQKNSTAVYSMEGLLLSTGTGEWDMHYVYDVNGFLIKGNNEYYTVIYEYDAAGLLKTETYANFDKQVFPDKQKEVYAYVDGRLKETRLTFVNNQEYITAETDRQGRIIKTFRYDFNLTTNKAVLDIYSLRSYDDANNLIKIEYKRQDGGLSGVITYEYDDHPVPPEYIPKGHQFKYRDSHNLTKDSSVGYDLDGKVFSESLSTMRFTYNAVGYPVKRELTSITKSSSFPTYESSTTTIYEYEGCL